MLMILKVKSLPDDECKLFEFAVDTKVQTFITETYPGYCRVKFYQQNAIDIEYYMEGTLREVVATINNTIRTFSKGHSECNS